MAGFPVVRGGTLFHVATWATSRSETQAPRVKLNPLLKLAIRSFPKRTNWEMKEGPTQKLAVPERELKDLTPLIDGKKDTAKKTPSATVTLEENGSALQFLMGDMLDVVVRNF